MATLVQLEKQFTQELRDACMKSVGAGYTPSRMIEMLRTTSGVHIAKEFVAQEKIHDGLKHAIKSGRPEWAVESIMLKPQFKPLFTAAELHAASWRIEQARKA